MFAFKTVVMASLVVASTCFAMAACSSDEAAPTEHDHDHDHSDLLPYCELPQACKDIIQHCHSKDDGVTPGKVHDCHETAHGEGDADECSKVRTECIEACDDAPSLGGEGSTPIESCEDGGDGDHDHDATDAG